MRATRIRMAIDRSACSRREPAQSLAVPCSFLPARRILVADCSEPGASARSQRWTCARRNRRHRHRTGTEHRRRTVDRAAWQRSRTRSRHCGRRRLDRVSPSRCSRWRRWCGPGSIVRRLAASGTDARTAAPPHDASAGARRRTRQHQQRRHLACAAAAWRRGSARLRSDCRDRSERPSSPPSGPAGASPAPADRGGLECDRNGAAVGKPIHETGIVRSTRARRPRYHTASFVAVPILAPHDTLGVICVTDKTGDRTFSARDVAVLRSFAAGAALAFAREHASTARTSTRMRPLSIRSPGCSTGAIWRSGSMKSYSDRGVIRFRSRCCCSTSTTSRCQRFVRASGGGYHPARPCRDFAHWFACSTCARGSAARSS